MQQRTTAKAASPQTKKLRTHRSEWRYWITLGSLDARIAPLLAGLGDESLDPFAAFVAGLATPSLATDPDPEVRAMPGVGPIRIFQQAGAGDSPGLVTPPNGI